MRVAVPLLHLWRLNCIWMYEKWLKNTYRQGCREVFVTFHLNDEVFYKSKLSQQFDRYPRSGFITHGTVWKFYRVFRKTENGLYALPPAPIYTYRILYIRRTWKQFLRVWKICVGWQNSWYMYKLKLRVSFSKRLQ